MVGENFAGNIIVNLANLPDFLRNPILKKRMMEFFSLAKPDQDEVINNALEAGPTIPFPNFAKLFKTWLEILASISDEKREHIFSKYTKQIISCPEKLINFNLDGIFEIFLSLGESEKKKLEETLKNIISRLDQKAQNRLFMIIPDSAKKEIGF